MKTKIIYGLIVAGIALAGCDTNTTETTRNTATTTSGATTRTPDPVKGAALFAANCAACHGSNATGTDQGPPLIHRIYEPSHHDDFSFYRAVSSGSRQHHWQFGDMPPVPGVSFEDTGHIIAWVRQQQRKAGIE